MKQIATIKSNKLTDVEQFKKLFPVTENSKLAVKYGVKESTIRLWGAKLKLNKKGWLWSRHDENYILRHYGQGKYTINDIAKKLNRTRYSIINKYREITNKRKKQKATI